MSRILFRPALGLPWLLETLLVVTDHKRIILTIKTCWIREGKEREAQNQSYVIGK